MDMSLRSGLLHGKGETRTRVKGRSRRVEKAVKSRVRAEVAERDGYCRAALLGGCAGRSEWAHAHERRRSQTRNRPAGERHLTSASYMLCTAHHQAYDAHRIQVEARSDRGADGPVVWRVKP